MVARPVGIEGNGNGMSFGVVPGTVEVLGLSEEERGGFGGKGRRGERERWMEILTLAQ